jgi:hypothetical protein
MDKLAKIEIEKFKYLAAMKKTVYITAGQCNDIFNVCAIHRNPMPNKWIDPAYSNQ